MNKALGETWIAQRYVVEMEGDAGRILGQFVDDVDDPEWSMCDRDRAKLAAAAPEMARLLLALHNEHGDRHTFDWAYWFEEIETVLAKAGVPYEK